MGEGLEKEYMKGKIIGAALMMAGVLPGLALEPASFPGGKEAEKEYFAKNMVYPERAKANGIEGTVYVEFTVNTDGTIGNIRIKRLVDPDLEGEAVRLVKLMPLWTPSSDNGTPVSSVAESAVPFTISD